LHKTRLNPNFKWKICV